MLCDQINHRRSLNPQNSGCSVCGWWQVPKHMCVWKCVPLSSQVFNKRLLLFSEFKSPGILALFQSQCSGSNFQRIHCNHERLVSPPNYHPESHKKLLQSKYFSKSILMCYKTIYLQNKISGLKVNNDWPEIIRCKLVCDWHGSYLFYTSLMSFSRNQEA